MVPGAATRAALRANGEVTDVPGGGFGPSGGVCDVNMAISLGGRGRARTWDCVSSRRWGHHGVRSGSGGALLRPLVVAAACLGAVLNGGGSALLVGAAAGAAVLCVEPAVHRRWYHHVR